MLDWKYLYLTKFLIRTDTGAAGHVRIRQCKQQRTRLPSILRLPRFQLQCSWRFCSSSIWGFIDTWIWEHYMAWIDRSNVILHKNVIHVLNCNDALSWDSTINGIRQCIFTNHQTKHLSESNEERSCPVNPRRTWTKNGRGICTINRTYYSHIFNPLKPELNPICYLLALLGTHHFLHVSRIRVKLLTFRRLMSHIYGAPILDVSRSHTTTQHSR